MEKKVKTRTVTMKLPCKFSCKMGEVCTYKTANVPFRVAMLLLGQHREQMHEVECSTGQKELQEFMICKRKDDP